MEQDCTTTREHGAPEFRAPTFEILKTALKRGFQDFVFSPSYGLTLGAIAVLIGWGLAWLTLATGHTFWLVLAAVGFPLLGPILVAGLYEISRRLEHGLPLSMSEIVGVVWQQRGRQLPWLCAIIVILFLFWFFIGHMIFALFLGLKAMTNISSSFEVYLSPAGLQMLVFGSLIGAGFAIVLYSFSVLALPMLLDREVDFVTSMIHSMSFVRAHPVTMLAWAVILAVLTFVSMLPGFLGLLIILPWLGHASWHVYSLLKS